MVDMSQSVSVCLNGCSIILLFGYRASCLSCSAVSMPHKWTAISTAKKAYGQFVLLLHSCACSLAAGTGAPVHMSV